MQLHEENTTFGGSHHTSPGSNVKGDIFIFRSFVVQNAQAKSNKTYRTPDKGIVTVNRNGRDNIRSTREYSIKHSFGLMQRFAVNRPLVDSREEDI